MPFIINTKNSFCPPELLQMQKTKEIIPKGNILTNYKHTQTCTCMSLLSIVGMNVYMQKKISSSTDVRCEM